MSIAMSCEGEEKITLAIVFVTNPKNSNVVPKNEVIMFPRSTIVTFESSSYTKNSNHVFSKS